MTVRRLTDRNFYTGRSKTVHFTRGHPAFSGDLDWWEAFQAAGINIHLALEMRNASSLADATKVGSVPSVVAGIPTFGPDGLICNADMGLNVGGAGFPLETISVYVIYEAPTVDLHETIFGVYQDLNSEYCRITKRDSAFDEMMVSNSSGSFAGNSPVHYKGGYGFAGLNCYRNGVYDGSIPAGTPDTIVNNMYLGSLHSVPSNTQHMTGTIAAFLMSPDTIPGSLFPRIHQAMASG